MSLTEQIGEIARAVAVADGRALAVQTVSVSDGEEGRVEILFTIAGCHESPCRFVVNLARADASTFATAPVALVGRLHARVVSTARLPRDVAAAS